jgi:hypothetical protein
MRPSASHLSPVQPQTYVIIPPCTIRTFRCSVSNQAVRPNPIDMLHCAARFLRHYLAQTRVAGRSCAIGNREILASLVAGKEDCNIVNRRDGVRGIRWKLQLAVGCNIESYLESIYASQLKAEHRKRGTYHHLAVYLAAAHPRLQSQA